MSVSPTVADPSLLLSDKSFNCCICIRQIWPTPEGGDEVEASHFHEPNYAQIRAGIHTAADLEKIRFGPGSNFWKSFFRAVIPKSDVQNRSAGPPYKISGIRQAHEDHYDQWVPTDPDEVCLFRSNDDSIEKHSLPLVAIMNKEIANRFNQPQMVLHERCWCLLNKVIGEARVREHFDLLVKALLGFGPLRRHPLERKVVPGWLGPPPPNWVDRPPWYAQHVEWVDESWHEQVPTDFFKLDPDPWRLVALETAIEDAVASRRAQILASAPTRVPLVPLPVEILVQICNDLCDDLPSDITESDQARTRHAWQAVRDVLNMSMALGWEIPDFFWKSLIPTDVAFECWDLASQDVDWKTLVLDMMPLMYGPLKLPKVDDKRAVFLPMWQWRSRLCRVRALQSIKEAFDMHVEEAAAESRLSHQFSSLRT